MATSNFTPSDPSKVFENTVKENIKTLKSLIENSNPLQYLMQLASERPEYKALSEYLIERSAMPPVSFGYLPQDVGGTFQQPGFFNPYKVPQTGAVTLNNTYLNRGYDPTNAVPTLTHELTHAAQLQMAKQRSQEEVANPQTKQQFLDAYKKLVYTDTKPKVSERFAQSVLAEKLNPTWYDENARYRASVNELPAWAMGSVVNQNPLTPYDDYKTPAHLNPTLATEFQILMDLATRDAKANPNKKKR